MMERNYDKLERMREEIRKDHERIAMLQEQVKAKEARLREAEGSRIVADVEAMKLSPEDVGALLDLIKAGKIPGIADASNPARVTKGRRKATAGKTEEDYFDEEDAEGEENDEGEN